MGNEEPRSRDDSQKKEIMGNETYLKRIKVGRKMSLHLEKNRFEKGDEIGEKNQKELWKEMTYYQQER